MERERLGEEERQGEEKNTQRDRYKERERKKVREKRREGKWVHTCVRETKLSKKSTRGGREQQDERYMFHEVAECLQGIDKSRLSWIDSIHVWIYTYLLYNGSLLEMLTVRVLASQGVGLLWHIVMVRSASFEPNVPVVQSIAIVNIAGIQCLIVYTSLGSVLYHWCTLSSHSSAHPDFFSPVVLPARAWDFISGRAAIMAPSNLSGDFFVKKMSKMQVTCSWTSSTSFTVSSLVSLFLYAKVDVDTVTYARVSLGRWSWPATFRACVSRCSVCAADVLCLWDGAVAVVLLQ